MLRDLFRKMDRFSQHQDIAQLFEEIGVPAYWKTFYFEELPITYVEDENECNFMMSAPGIPRHCIDVSLTDDVLSIVVKKPEEKSISNRLNAHLKKHEYPIVRRYKIDTNTIDENKIVSKLEDGILYITLNKISKKPEEKKKKIPVN